MERKNLEDAIAIARAEAESEWKDQADQLRVQLERSGHIQPHLGPVVSSALIAADTDGRIIGWSGGAALLDGRTEAEALGRTIHQDVVRLEGVKWKSLFGKVVVEGVIEEEVTLLTADGEPRDVLLKAAIVKDAGGKLLGVTEVLVPPELRGDPSLHAQAAFGRLALPLHQALEARALAGLDSQRRAAAAVQDLQRLGQAVLEEGGWADVLATARAIALPDLMKATTSLLRGADDSWMELRATAQDLGLLGGLLEDDSNTEVRWNDLVGRCLYAVQARGGGATVTREFGDGGTLRVRTDRLVPLLLLLLEPLAHPGEATVRASIADGVARLEVDGARPVRHVLGVARALARELAGVVRVEDGVVVATLPTDAPSSGASPSLALDGDEDRTELISGDISALLASAKADSDLSDLVEVGPAEEDDLLVESLEADEDEDEEPTGHDADDVTRADPAAPATEDPTDDGVEELQPDPSPTSDPPPKGSVEFLAEGEYGDLLLAAGEDSVIAPLSELAPDLIDVGGAGRMDALEDAFTDADTGVSPDLLAQAAEMEAFAQQRGGDDKLEDSGARPASDALLREMTETDTGERMGKAAPKTAAPTTTQAEPEPSKPARGRRSRKGRKKS